MVIEVGSAYTFIGIVQSSNMLKGVTYSFNKLKKFGYTKVIQLIN